MRKKQEKQSPILISGREVFVLLYSYYLAEKAFSIVHLTYISCFVRFLGLQNANQVIYK